MTGLQTRFGLWSTADTTAPRPTALKAPITGVLPRGVGQVLGRQAVLGGVVADTYWTLLQPTEGGDIDTTATAPHSYVEIVNALATGLPIRLRVHCGDHSPTWAKALGGGVLTIDDAEHGDGASLSTVPRWWSPSYLNAWEGLMRKLAAILEPNAQLREVASHPATTIYAEPLQRGTRPLEATAGPNVGKTNVQVFYEAMHATDSRAGYADVQRTGSTITGPALLDAGAVMWPLDAVGSVSSGSLSTLSRWRSFGWETTRYYLPFNPFQQWQVTATSPFAYRGISDPGEFTALLMGYASSNLRSRVVIGNNSLRVPLAAAGPAYPQMYADQVAQTTGNGYQTASFPNLRPSYRAVHAGATDSQVLAAVLDVAFGVTTSAHDPEHLVTAPVTALRARSVELPDGWSPALTNAQALSYNTVAAGNPTGD